MISEIRRFLTIGGKGDVQRWKRFGLTLMVVVFLAVVVSVAISSLAAPVQIEESSVSRLTRGQRADAERYMALGESYKKVDEARQRAIFAETARWNAQAEYYQGIAARERVRAAETARLEGLADYYEGR